MSVVETRDGLGLLRRLSAVAVKIHSGHRLEDTLQAVADVVVEQIGFGIAAVNYRRPEGGYEMVAVAGSQDCADQLLGVTISDAEMSALLAGSEEWGPLRFVPHGRSTRDPVHTWTPTFVPLDEPDAWHPEDSLFAPLVSPAGSVLGLLSVDLPANGRRPDALQRELLEVLALEAGMAISAAELTTRLREEHEHLRREQAALRASEEAFRFAFDGSATGMAMVGLDPADPGQFLRVNEALCLLLGYAADDLIGSDLVDYAAGTSAAAVASVLYAAAAGRPIATQADCRFLHGSGREGWLTLTSTVIAGTAAQPPFLLVHAEDAGARIARDELLVHEAGHDPLTALPNRRLLLERLEAALGRARVHGSTTTVMFCDLDNFKAINDAHGHRTGDVVLEAVARRLGAELRTRDTVARLGGDEFVVLADNLAPRDIGRLRERLQIAVATPLDHPAGTVVGVSIGVVTVDGSDPSQDALAVLQEVDQAMYREKNRRRESV